MIYTQIFAKFVPSKVNYFSSDRSSFEHSDRFLVSPRLRIAGVAASAALGDNEKLGSMALMVSFIAKLPRPSREARRPIPRE
jgi:hypothetical protein